jgi:flagellar basal body-associated protein FliL
MNDRGAVNIKIIAAVVLVAILAAAGAAYFLVIKPKMPHKPKPAKKVDWEKEFTIVEEDGFKEMTFTTADGRYFVVTLAFEIPLKAKGLPEELKGKKAMISESIYQVMGTYQLDELIAPDKQKDIKEHLKNVINTHLDKGKIQSVIFESFASQ